MGARRVHDVDRPQFVAHAEGFMPREKFRALTAQFIIDDLFGSGRISGEFTVPKSNQGVAMARDIAAGIGVGDAAPLGVPDDVFPGGKIGAAELFG
jgi:hypothetical protein